MKDVTHDHLVRFIGASVTAPHCCLLTEYCPRGSLEDILENDQIQLDAMFRRSLMHDITKVSRYMYMSHIIQAIHRQEKRHVLVNNFHSHGRFLTGCAFKKKYG